MQWTDKIRQVKIVLVVAAILIAVVSLVVSHLLIRDLAEEERSKTGVWAEAMKSLNNADEKTDLNLVLKVINGNNTIPVIVKDASGNIQAYRNVKIKASNAEDSTKFLCDRTETCDKIRIYINENNHDAGYLDVYYSESVMLQRLAYYPYVQLGVVMIFVVIAIFALLTSKRAEQNKVWVGLSKETAHQLGTPISSLMAWTQILKETYPDDELLPEMDKDVQRLQLIADRFSKIGSLPEPVPANLNEVIDHVVTYMERRTSKKVNISTDIPGYDVIVPLNASLFEWVVENLCKNAVDAMEGVGSITINIEDSDTKVMIDVTDTGKGIKKKDVKNVFRPGFTTKQRGWGLGLSLARRIVEEYHKGRIYVKNSEIGRGTTFRIELKK